MNNKELKERWYKNDSENKEIAILHAIKNKQKLQNCDAVTYYNEKVDLRGFHLPKPDEITFIHSYQSFKNAFSINEYLFENIDFSFADSGNWTA